MKRPIADKKSRIRILDQAYKGGVTPGSYQEHNTPFNTGISANLERCISSWD